MTIEFISKKCELKAFKNPLLDNQKLDEIQTRNLVVLARILRKPTYAHIIRAKKNPTVTFYR